MVDMSIVGNVVAKLLDPTYTVEQRYGQSVTIRKPNSDGWGIVLTNTKGRITISGDYPEAKDGRNFSNAESSPYLNLPESSSTEKIAKAIKNKLLSEYQTVYDDVQDKIISHNVYLDIQKEMVERFVALTGGEVQPNRDRINVPFNNERGYFSDFYVNASKNTVNMNLNSIPADVAEKIIKLMGF